MQPHLPLTKEASCQENGNCRSKKKNLTSTRLTFLTTEASGALRMDKKFDAGSEGQHSPVAVHSVMKELTS
jgi:hypothetical protein